MEDRYESFSKLERAINGDYHFELLEILNKNKKKRFL